MPIPFFRREEPRQNGREETTKEESQGGKIA